MENKVRGLIKTAMIEKNEVAKLTYKSVLDGALKLAKMDGNRAVKDEDFVKAAQNEIKSYKDLEDILNKNPEANKTRIEEAETKIKLCEVLLPTMATEEEIREYLTANNVEKNIGVCMKTLKAQFGATLDGKMANAIVREYIDT